MSLPDERSIVIGDERGERDLLSLPHGGQQPAQCLTPTHGNYHSLLLMLLRLFVLPCRE